jgi:NAD(P)-dependent dehydrogenase (short-subunit alcohol dehydrogenase family)
VRFKDRVTIVTGGASGLGKVTAQDFAREGSTVIILDILEEKARSIAGEIEALGGKAVATKVDATKGQEVKRAVEKIAREWGRIDILINCLGWSESVPFLESDEALWRKVLDLNLISMLLCCHAVLPYMIKQQYGRIVNIASIAGRQPRPMAVAYGAAKAGVISVTKSLAVAMAPYNIRVNCIAPGPMDTDLIRQLRPEHAEAILRRVTLGRWGQPEEVANAVLFLASDEASYIVGQTLTVDGGNNML